MCTGIKSGVFPPKRNSGSTFQGTAPPQTAHPLGQAPGSSALVQTDLGTQIRPEPSRLVGRLRHRGCPQSPCADPTQPQVRGKGHCSVRETQAATSAGGKGCPGLIIQGGSETLNTGPLSHWSPPTTAWEQRLQPPPSARLALGSAEALAGGGHHAPRLPASPPGLHAAEQMTPSTGQCHPHSDPRGKDTREAEDRRPRLPTAGTAGTDRPPPQPLCLTRPVFLCFFSKRHV